MHPIERLRYVARASGVPQNALLQETASAMMSFVDDRAALLTACRRMVTRQPESGNQVTLAATMLTAPEPRRGAWDMVEAVDDDTTGKRLIDSLADNASLCVVGWPEVLARHINRRGDIRPFVVDMDGSGWGLIEHLTEMGLDAVDVDARGLGVAARDADVTVLEAVACGPEEALVGRGGLAAAAVARSNDRDVWLATPVGSVLPDRMWSGLIGRYNTGVDEWDADYEVLPLEQVTKVCGPKGPVDPERVLDSSICPIAPELFT